MAQGLQRVAAMRPDEARHAPGAALHALAHHAYPKLAARFIEALR